MIYYTIFTNGCQVKIDREFWVEDYKLNLTFSGTIRYHIFNVGARNVIQGTDLVSPQTKSSRPF